MSLSWADSYYRVARDASLTVETVPCVDLREFTNLAQQVGRRLNEAQTEEALSFRRVARRASWDLLNTAVSFDAPMLGIADAAEVMFKLAEKLRHCLPGSVAPVLFDVADRLAALGRDSSDPLGTAASEVLSVCDLRQTVVVVHNSSTAAATQESFRSRGLRVSVVTPAETRRMAPGETMLLIGQAKFYPQSLLWAARAESTCIVRYEWLNDQGGVECFLPGSNSRDVVRPIRSSNTVAGDAELDDFIAPSIDWDAIERDQFSAHADHAADGGEESCRVRMFLLADSFAVYLEDDSGSIEVVDLDAEDDDRVQSRPMRSLRRGDFVLLRGQKSGTEFIEEMADEIMGASAEELRTSQVRWKEGLRKRVSETSIAQVVSDLRDSGSRVQNVTWWINQISIAPRNYDDFAIVMAYSGLSDETDSIWMQMATIRQAHDTAGQRNRRQLRDRLRVADLTLLVRNGWMDFELANDEAGRLTAFQIEAAAPSTTEISRTRVRSPFRVDRDLWLG